MSFPIVAAIISDENSNQRFEFSVQAEGLGKGSGMALVVTDLGISYYYQFFNISYCLLYHQ